MLPGKVKWSALFLCGTYERSRAKENGARTIKECHEEKWKTILFSPSIELSPRLSGESVEGEKFPLQSSKEISLKAFLGSFVEVLQSFSLSTHKESEMTWKRCHLFL